MKRKEQVNQEKRRAHAEKVKHSRVLADPAPEGNRRPNHPDKEHRVQQSNLAAEELEEKLQSWLYFPWPAQIGPVRQVLYCWPVPLGVPNQHRQGTNPIDQQSQIR